MNLEVVGSSGLGDAPAKMVIEKNRSARFRRNAEETSEELAKISSRIEQTLYDYENLANVPLNLESRRASLITPRKSIEATLEFLQDVTQLSKIISDPVSKKKYQQNVAIFVVGYENLCVDRLELLSQINESLCGYKNEQPHELGDPEFDVDFVGRYVKKTINDVIGIQTKLKDIGQSVANVLHKFNKDKRKSSKKKTEKELAQTREHILSITEKLVAAQHEVETTTEQISHAYRKLEIKQIEVERLNTQIDASKKKSQDFETLNKDLEDGDGQIKELIRENDRLSFSITQHKENYEHLQKIYKQSQADQQEMEASHKKQKISMEEQLRTLKKDTEIFYEKKISEMKLASQTELYEEKMMSKKKLASMDATIRELRADLTKTKQNKEEAVNGILTQQAQQEISDQKKSFDDSITQILNYEKELKASQDKNKQLQKKLKQKSAEKIKRKNHKPSISNLPTQTGITTSDSNERQTVINVDDVKKMSPLIDNSHNDENLAVQSEEVLSELAGVRSKFNQKMLLLNKLIESQRKFMEERDELFQQVEMSNITKDKIKEEMQQTRLEMDKMRSFNKRLIMTTNMDELHQLKQNKVQQQHHKYRTQTMDIGMMTSPIHREEKPPINTCSIEMQTVSDYDNRHKVMTNEHTPRSVKSCDSNTSDVIERFESCLHHRHPMILNITKSYENIMQLKDDVITMLQDEEDSKEYETIVQQITMEEIAQESDDSNVADIVLKMAVNSTRILTILQQVIPLFMGRNAELCFPSLMSHTSNLKPDPPISVDLANRSTNVTQKSVKNQETQKNGLFPGTRTNKVMKKYDDIEEDYKALIHKHNNLQQEFINLEKEFMSKNTSRDISRDDHFLSNNAATIHAPKTTTSQLRDQLKNTLYSNDKSEEFIFTRVDVEHNERTFRQELRFDQIDENTLNETKQVMDDYTNISVQRWRQLVQKCLHRTRIKSIKKTMGNAQCNTELVVNQLKCLQHKRECKHNIKSSHLSTERIRLAKDLIERLGNIEKKTGVFLIKPIATLHPSLNVIQTESAASRNNTYKTHPSIPIPRYLASNNDTFLSTAIKTEVARPPLWKPTTVDDKSERCEIMGNSELRLPKLLELDVNRAMYSENCISTTLSPKNGFGNKDTQLNLISYMTVERPGSLVNLDTLNSRNSENDNKSSLASIKRPTSLPALRSRLSLVTEETLIDHYKRSLATWTSKNERHITQSPMIQF